VAVVESPVVAIAVALSKVVVIIALQVVVDTVAVSRVAVVIVTMINIPCKNRSIVWYQQP